MEIRIGTLVELYDAADKNVVDRGTITDIIVLLELNQYSIVLESQLHSPGRPREFAYFPEEKCWRILTEAWWGPCKEFVGDGPQYRLQVIARPPQAERAQVASAPT